MKQKEKDWHKPDANGPAGFFLPKQAWCVGLGHLGQAYLWTLGLMPFSNPKSCFFILQDDDKVDETNLGPQILSNEDYIGDKKARVCSRFLTDLGFRTQIIEKPFTEYDQLEDWSHNFKILLLGVDNIKTRRIVDPSRFKIVLDGSTNGRLELFDSCTIRNLNLISKPPSKIWNSQPEESGVLHKNLQRMFEQSGMCGQVKLLNKSISTPFVGLFCSALLIAELIRSLNQGTIHSSISGQMREVNSIQVVEKPGYNHEIVSLATL